MIDDKASESLEIFAQHAVYILHKGADAATCSGDAGDGHPSDAAPVAGNMLALGEVLIVRHAADAAPEILRRVGVRAGAQGAAATVDAEPMGHGGQAEDGESGEAVSL